MVNIIATREVSISTTPQIIDKRLIQWSRTTEFTCKSKSESSWQCKRGKKLKTALTTNLWDLWHVPTIVDIQIITKKPLKLSISYQVKSTGVFFTGDEENKMVNLFLEHLLAYLTGAFDSAEMPIPAQVKSKNETVKQCSNCNSSIDHNFQFCPHCGLTLQLTCSNCGEVIDTKFNLCPFCGIEQR